MAKTTIFDLCKQQALATLGAMNEAFQAFVRDLGGADHLPPKFTLSAPAMNDLESAIEDAVAARDLQKTEDLCDQYRQRFTAYLDAWRRKAQKGAAQC